MSRQTHLASPDQTLREVAFTMSEQDIGAMPVGENGRLVGMITDRDIAIRGVAEGRNPGTKVREIMTEQIRTCFESDDIDQVAREMAELQMRRLPVLDQEKRLVGIVSLGDLATSGKTPGQAEAALHGVSRSD
jgi:CBS domain-containing protein